MNDEKIGFSVVWVRDSTGAPTIPVAAKESGAFLIHPTVGESGWSITVKEIGATFASGLTREDAEKLASSLGSPAWSVKTRAEAIARKPELRTELCAAVTSIGIPGDYSSGGNFHAEYD